MSPKVVNKEEKKRQIAEAAIQVYAEKGAKNTRIIDIARRAGIGKGTVYEYFRSQDEILLECFSLIMNQMDEAALEILKEEADPETKLKEIFRSAWFSLAKYPPDFLNIFLVFWSEGIRHPEEPNSLFTRLKTFYHAYRKQISGILDDGIRFGHFRPVDTTAVASVLLSTIDGLLLQIMIDRNAFDKSLIADKTLDMLFEGIKTKT